MYVSELRPENLIALCIPLTYLIMVVVERLGTGHRWPPLRHWQITGMHFLLMQGVINGITSGLLVRALDGFHLVSLSAFGEVTSALVAYGVLSLGNALMHGSYHRYDLLWRYVHRMHHAPQRMDVAGVMYQSPLEALGASLLFVFVAVFLFGLNPVASMLCAYIAAFYGMFQHFNIHTPSWIGYFIQRPEAHCLHHRRDVHAWNYSDFPLWDMLWGTFRNPRSFEGELGLCAGHPDTWALIRGRGEADARAAASSR